MTNNGNIKPNSISAVLPLAARGSYDVDDLGRAKLLFKSLSFFSEPGLFDCIYLVVPENQISIMKENFSEWNDRFNIEIISEDELVPEFKNHPNIRGWRKQQVIKIAIASRVKTNFYLTLDADIICLKPIIFESLVKNGKALIDFKPTKSHPKWWASSNRIWKVKRSEQNNPDRGMGVTPALLSSRLCQNIMKDLCIWPNLSWAEQLCRLHSNRVTTLLPKYYLMRKWTEYSVYFVYASKSGELDKYHNASGTDQNPNTLTTWAPSHDIENWDVDFAFSEECSALFSVIQSKSAVDPAAIEKIVSPYIKNIS